MTLHEHGAGVTRWHYDDFRFQPRLHEHGGVKEVCCLDGITDQHPYQYAGGVCNGCPREPLLTRAPLPAHVRLRTPVEPTSPHDPRYWKC